MTEAAIAEHRLSGDLHTGALVNTDGSVDASTAAGRPVIFAGPLRAMTRLVAVAFPYETTASAAAEDMRSVALDVLLDADSVAVVSRDPAGAFHVTTNHEQAGDCRMRGVFWLVLFSVLFFGPADSTGSPAGGGRSQRIRDIGIDERFTDRVRELLQPGTSALFLAAEPAVPAAAPNVIEFGGTVVTTPLSPEAEWELRRPFLLADRSASRSEADGQV